MVVRNDTIIIENYGECELRKFLSSDNFKPHKSFLIPQYKFSLFEHWKLIKFYAENWWASDLFTTILGDKLMVNG